MASTDQEESRYGVASLDQMDDDDGPSTAAPAAAVASSPSAAGSSNGDAAAAAPAAPVVESYGTAVGVIEPPPDLKLIIDRTADFVRRVGPQFEGEIMQRNKGKKQFQFLENPASPYHPYYKQRVKYGAEGPPVVEGDAAAQAIAAARAADERAQKEAEEKEAAAAAAAAAIPKVLTLNEKLRAYVEAAHRPDRVRLDEANAKAKEKETATAAAQAAGTPVPVPAAFSFRSTKHPDQYSAVDIDIIKLTALYLARNGIEFLHGLQRRESRNPYFDFLKPQHSLFVFFQHLVDSYKHTLLPSRLMRDELEAQVRGITPANHWHQLLVDAVVRKKAAVAANAAKQSEEDERSSVSAIDWKDFVVVESISFIDDEDEFLPVPRDSVEEMAAMLSAQGLEDTIAPGPIDQDMDMDVDMDTETKPTAVAAPAPASTEDEVSRLIRSTVRVPQEEVLEIRANVEDDASTKTRAAVFQKCIVCGDEIAIDDLAEHMRIELLDPRWKEQKQALLDRQRESSLASDSVVGVNLARMAKRTQQMQGDDQAAGQRSELKARKQALADAILLYGPHSLQAREAAARAGEIAPPPPPPAPKPVAPQAAPIGPTAPPRPGMPAMPQPPAASAHIPQRPPAPVGPPAGIPVPVQPVGPPRPAMPMAPPQPIAAPGMGPPGMAPYQPQPGMMPPGMAPPGMYPGFPYGAMPSPPPGAYPGMVPSAVMPPGVVPGAYPGMVPTFVMPPPPAAAPGIVPSAAFPPAMVGAMPPGMAMSMAVHAAPPVEDEPASKKQRVGEASGKGKLLSEAEYLASRPHNITLTVVVPSDPSVSFNFNGQSLSLQLTLTDTVAVLKERLSGLLNGMPGNKMKLQFAPGSGGAHLNKDDTTLAFYNTPQEATVNVGVKERGGKKK